MSSFISTSILNAAGRQLAARRFASTQSLSQQSTHSLSKLMPVEVYPLIVLVGTICTGSVYAMAYTLNKGDLRLFPSSFGATGVNKKSIWEE